MAGDLRYCRYCNCLIVEREMWGPGATNMNGATEPARSLGLMWIGPNRGGETTVCDVRRYAGGSDRHEPLPLSPDLTDRQEVERWLTS